MQVGGGLHTLGRALSVELARRNRRSLRLALGSQRWGNASRALASPSRLCRMDSTCSRNAIPSYLLPRAACASSSWSAEPDRSEGAAQQRDAADKHATTSDGARLQLISVFDGPTDMSANDYKGTLSRRLKTVGWLCATGVALVILDSALVLPTLPEAWWRPAQPLQVDTSTMHLDFRMMTHMSLLGWLGGWGYMGGLLWLPIAVTRMVKGWLNGQHANRADLAVLGTLCGLVLGSIALVHLTPLRDVSFCHFVL